MTLMRPNKIAKLTNLVSLGEHQGYSAWGPEHNLSQQIAVVMPRAAGVVLERAGEPISTPSSSRWSAISPGFWWPRELPRIVPSNI